MLQEHLTSCLIIVNTGKWDKILLQACLNFCSFGWVYIVCVCSQVAAPIAYAAPAVTKYAAPALGYAAFGSYGLDYLHWSIAQVHTHTHTHTHTYIHTYIRTCCRDVTQRNSTCRHTVRFVIVSDKCHLLSTTSAAPLVQVDSALATLIRLAVR